MTLDEALHELALRAVDLIPRINGANITVVTIDLWDGMNGEKPVTGVKIECLGKPMAERN